MKASKILIIILATTLSVLVSSAGFAKSSKSRSGLVDETIRKNAEARIEFDSTKVKQAAALSNASGKKNNYQTGAVKTPASTDTSKISKESDREKRLSLPELFIAGGLLLLSYDPDDDGYYNKFGVELSFSVDSGYRDIYTKLYVRDGYTSWEHIYSSDPFTITYSSTPRYFEIETRLTEGYSSGYYDVMVEVYDSETDAIIDIYGPDQSSEFIEIALESDDYEDARIFDYEIFSIDTVLYGDDDYDGFYNQYQVTLDIDTTFVRSDLYAEVYLRNNSYAGVWQYEYTTDIFTVRGLNSNDKLIISADLIDGYSRGYYDVLIEVYDADSDEMVLEIGPENFTLSDLELEDAYSDGAYVNGSSGTTSVYTEVSGAGSLDKFFALLSLGLVSISLYRRKKRSPLADHQR